MVVHLAGRPGVLPSIEEPCEYYKNNVISTINLLEQLRLYKVKKIVFGSSSSVYDDRYNGFFNESKTPLKPRSAYGSTKKNAESIIEEWARHYELDCVILRFFSVYGPRMRPDLAIPKFSKLLLADSPIIVYGDGSSQRDYTYIDDIVTGTLKAMNFLNSRSGVFETFNLGNGNPVKITSLISCLESVFAKKAVVEYIEGSSAEMYITAADLKKSREILDYDPNVALESGLRKFASWFNSENKHV